MDRRQFVRYTAILTAGTLAVPGELAFARPPLANAVVAMPITAEHVRHGSFSLKAIEHPALPPWLRLFERHLFYKNGISRGEADMSCMSFTACDIHFTVSQKDRQLRVLVNDQCHEIDLDKRQEILLADLPGLKAVLLSIDAEEKISRSSYPETLLVLSGCLEHGPEVIPEYSVLCPAGRNDHTLHARTPTVVIVLSTKGAPQHPDCRGAIA